MATNDGNFFRGIVGNAIFRVLNGKQIVQQRETPGTRKQSDETKKNSNTFGMAATLGAQIRRTMATKIIQKVDSTVAYEALSKKLVLQSEQYRVFLFNYLRRNHRGSDDIYYSKFNNAQQFAPWIEYDRSKIIQAGFVQNWYIAKSLLFSFQHYDTDDTEKIMYQYFSQSNDNVFKPSVMKFWLGNVKFKSGRPAPAIKLRDSNNNIIQLSDYKGRIVYLNFWGVHCGPCLVQIDNYLGRLSQQQNSNKFVIINICLDENRVNWLDAVKKHKVPGVNLFSSFGDTTAKQYSITSIPHYVLVNTDGSIIDYSAPPPSILTSDNRILGAILK